MKNNVPFQAKQARLKNPGFETDLNPQAFLNSTDNVHLCLQWAGHGRNYFKILETTCLPIKTSLLSICADDIKLKGLCGKITPSMVGARLISRAYCSRSAAGIYLKHCIKVSSLMQSVFVASCSDCDAPC